MAVDFRIVLYANDRAQAEAAAAAAFDRVKKLNDVFSDYDAESELRRLSDRSGPGTPLKVSDDLWQVLVKAQWIAEKSDGAFDVTCGNIVRLWRRARRQKELPADDKLREARALTGNRLLRLDAAKRTAEVLKPGVRLDVGGIAKGYATQAALDVLRQHGLAAAMVEAGGDLVVGDPPPGKAGWRIGIAPSKPGGPPRFYLTVARTAVATSGDLWQFVVIDGVRYSHIVDPRTGVGLTERLHVSVIHPDGPTADALSTAVSVLGVEKGLKLVDAIPDAAAVILKAGEGEPQISMSARWKDLVVEKP